MERHLLTLLPHLLELRRRCLIVLGCFALVFLGLFLTANTLFHAVVAPLLQQLPGAQGLIATQITSPVLTPLKLAGDLAMLLTTPLALYHLWCFASPGLYRGERRYLRLALVMSMVLFLLGMIFCFYIILPYMFGFFIQALPKQVQFMPDIAYTLDFITRMLLLFGLCFQVPLICLALVKLKLTSYANLKMIRPYVIVGAFVLGMLLTPPDVLSQIMLAVPLWFLYELGLVLLLVFD